LYIWLKFYFKIYYEEYIDYDPIEFYFKIFMMVNIVLSLIFGVVCIILYHEHILTNFPHVFFYLILFTVMEVACFIVASLLIFIVWIIYLFCCQNIYESALGMIPFVFYILLHTAHYFLFVVSLIILFNYYYKLGYVLFAFFYY